MNSTPKTAAAGAATTAYCATSRRAAGSGYYVNCNLAIPGAAAMDERLQRKVWDLATRLCEREEEEEEEEAMTA
eukprot:31483-Pelagococcus_subviridis.AAC.8